MDSFINPHRGAGLQGAPVFDAPEPSTDAEAVETLLAHCPAAAETPLVEAHGLARALRLERLHVKDERARMGLGSFKALGAAYVIAHQAAQTGAADLSGALAGRAYVTASAGNHGLSVAAGARLFGARAVVYLAETVPETFADRLRDKGAEVRRAGPDYAAGMAAAETAARDEGMILLSDSSWAGYTHLPWRLMEGYLAMAAETVRQMPDAPTHIYLQAGVGGLAGAAAGYFRAAWGAGPRIIVVEPRNAPALMQSLRAGRVIDTDGPDSHMGRLDCKTPSAIALRGLSRDADCVVTISEDEGAAVLPLLSDHGLATSSSGGAGLAAVRADPPAGARVLCILSEAPA
jgi:diaminopropionate ammonia-lyase